MKPVPFTRHLLLAWDSTSNATCEDTHGGRTCVWGKFQTGVRRKRRLLCLGHDRSGAGGAEGDKTRVSRAQYNTQPSLEGRPGAFSNTHGGIWGSELEGVGEGGGKRDTCKPDVSSIAPHRQVQLGEGGSLASLGCSCNFHKQVAGCLPSLRAETCRLSSSSITKTLRSQTRHC